VVTVVLEDITKVLAVVVLEDKEVGTEVVEDSKVLVAVVV
jgi:hypothetical protein